MLCVGNELRSLYVYVFHRYLLLEQVRCALQLIRKHY